MLTLKCHSQFLQSYRIFFVVLDPQLVAEVSRALGGVTIVHKGSTDYISNGNFTEECSADGCPRRYEYSGMPKSELVRISDVRL